MFDKVNARKLAQLLRAGLLSPVYHGEHSVRDLKELVRSYEYLVEDSTRVMNRIKALYRSRAIACAGADVYKPQQRQAWLEKLPEAGVRARAACLYCELDHLTGLRREARQAMLVESRRHAASKILRQVPTLGTVRIAQLIAALATPHRFRSKRQFWSIAGWRCEHVRASIIILSAAMFDALVKRQPYDGFNAMSRSSRNTGVAMRGLSALRGA